MIILLSKEDIGKNRQERLARYNVRVPKEYMPTIVETAFDELELGLLVDIYIVEEGKHIKEQNGHAKNPVRRR